MPKLVVTLKMVRNALIALVTAVWVYPLYVFLIVVLDILELQENELVKSDYGFQNGWDFSASEFAQWVLPIVMVLLALVIVFWAFVAANKIWPIKRSKTNNS
jgi:hypothetical protein